MRSDHWFHRKHGKKWIGIFLGVFINLGVILWIILSLEPLWGDINYYVGEMLGVSEFIYILILLIVIPVIYLGILLFLNVWKLMHRNKIKPNLGHKIAAISLGVFFDLILIVLINLFGEEAVIVAALFEDISIYLYLALIVGLFICLYPILGIVERTKTQVKTALIITGIVIGLGIGFSIPFLFLPVNVINGELPPKPEIIAHRGGAHLAPENTLIAAELAANLSCAGWEIDVQISYDGIPFLCHDDTLKRTTNVASVFPGSENKRAAFFNMSELKLLDAGSWFVDTDPYGAIAKGWITPTQAASYRGVQIPTLEEAVDFTRDHGLILNVDFKGVNADHPYYSQYFNICLNVLKAGGIDNQIWITNYNRANLDFAKTQAPNMIFVFSFELSNPVDVTEFLTWNYTMINIPHGMPYGIVRSYLAADVPINTWTVDLSFRYSQLWCLGVTYVTTNEPNKFVGMTQPTWYLHTETYVLFWSIVYIVGLGFIFTLRYEPTPLEEGTQ
ncbi:MAG: glycerophosphodiester phosphodiesterase family protein [Candidatus Helarchaeota archaeon]